MPHKKHSKAQQSRKFTHLTLGEREIIRKMKYRRASIADIARAVGKTPKTIYREIYRNSHPYWGWYHEKDAQRRVRDRRINARKWARRIDNDSVLEARVLQHLSKGLSPEQIAGYMKESGDVWGVSFKTIYRWIRREWQSRKHLLRYKGKSRTPYGTGRFTVRKNKKHISERPAIVEKRRRAGDWEADLVHGVRDDSMHCILTLNDRASGHNRMWKIETGVQSLPVCEAIVHLLQHFPVHTITCDNGTEFSAFEMIEERLGCSVYFSDPSKPQQRGSNENLNGLVRDYFPKGMSLEQVTNEDVQRVSKLLNWRPRKRFGYMCPAVVFSKMTGISLHKLMH